MDPSMYGAAMQGKEDFLEHITQDLLITAPNGNTVLHIAAQYGKEEWIHKLFSSTMDPSLLSKLLRAENNKREKAIHVAASEGHSKVIRALIQHAQALDGASNTANDFSVVQDILTCINEDGDTALHVALRSSLASQLQDTDAGKSFFALGTLSMLFFSSFAYFPNRAHESVLYLAAECKSYQLVKKIVDTGSSAQTYGASSSGTALHAAIVIRDEKETTKFLFNWKKDLAREGDMLEWTPLDCAAHFGHAQRVQHCAASSDHASVANYGGPRGRTALHAAVISNDKETTELLLDWKKDLAREGDMLGWTPLHCAAHFGHAERVQQLLEADHSLAYLTTTKKDGENTALHIAAVQGCVSVIEQLVSGCLGCWEIVNARGQNVFHVAIENNQQKVIKCLGKNPSLGFLINQKDIDGNTPIHLAAKDCRVLDLSRIKHSRLLRMSFNKDNKTPLDILASSVRGSLIKRNVFRKRLINAGLSQVSRDAITVSGKQQKTAKALANGEEDAEIVEEEEGVMANREATLLVAALVATVTFTAGITVPGGYNQNEGPNQGSAMLLKHPAFQVFVVADALALMLSSTALLFYFFNVLQSDPDVVTKSHRRVSTLTYFSVLAMVLAFITGTYSVLSRLPLIAVLICGVTTIYFVLVIVMSSVSRRFSFL